MLTDLHINNVAIIESLHLNFTDGLTALTGETGAGKSILLDALSMVLGARADKDYIRHGKDKADISACFDLSAHPRVQKWLNDNDFASEEASCVCRRVITADGRSRAYINQIPCTLGTLKTLSEQLIDIHGQHAHQLLQHASHQRALVDQFGNHNALLSEVQTAYKHLHAIKKEHDELELAATERTSKLDYLAFQCQEFSGLNLSPDHLNTLFEQHTQAAHADDLAQAVHQSLALLEDSDTGVISQLHAVRGTLNALSKRVPSLANVLSSLNQADLELNEVISALNDYSEHDALSPEAYAELDQTVATVHQLARKHKVDALELEALAETLQTEHDALDNADEHLETLKKEVKKATDAYQVLANKLTKKRQQASTKLAKAANVIMQDIGLGDATLRMQVDVDNEHLGANGQDQIHFMVQTNPGQPFKPMAKIASGGELSRMGLAIQVSATQAKDVPTMIFDEVDAGISGEVAEQVGLRLRELGKRAQVLCVTHLAQVASAAHQHLYISKSVDKNETRTSITELSKAERIEEIARMLGGKTLSDNTKNAAKDMLSRA